MAAFPRAPERSRSLSTVSGFAVFGIGFLLGIILELMVEGLWTTRLYKFQFKYASIQFNPEYLLPGFGLRQPLWRFSRPTTTSRYSDLEDLFSGSWVMVP